MNLKNKFKKFNTYFSSNFFFQKKDSIGAESTVIDLTENENVPETTLQPSALEQSVDRTLCDSQLFNANSISTPFTSSLRKQIPTQILSNLEMSSMCVSI